MFRNANLRDMLGIALIFAFVVSIPLLIFKSIPNDNEQLIAYMLGQLSGFVSAIVAFHYVTKSGEKELELTRAENTGKMADAITAAQKAPGKIDPEAPPQEVTVVSSKDDPVHTEDALTPSKDGHKRGEGK